MCVSPAYRKSLDFRFESGILLHKRDVKLGKSFAFFAIALAASNLLWTDQAVQRGIQPDAIRRYGAKLDEYEIMQLAGDASQRLGLYLETLHE
jgi:hypothetical protein